MQDVPTFKAFYLSDRQSGWMDQASCRGEPAELWFPEPPQNRQKSEIERYAREVQIAQEICAECPVRDACLKDAKELGVQDGIWGGVNFYRPSREKVA